MKDTYYFSHDYNARADIKIKKLISRHGMTGYGIFWAIVEDLYNNANALPTDYESIAFDVRSDRNLVESVITEFDLFVIDGATFGSSSVERRLNERNAKSDKARESARKRWGSMRTHSESTANLVPTQSKGNPIKERKGKENKEKDTKNSDLVIQIVRVLNEVTESDFRPSSKATSKLILARINDGYSFDELKDVILHKTAQWKNDHKMKSYLRPETIFGSKFESYLQEAKKNISDDPETKYQRLKARGFKNVSKEEIIWVFNYQHRTPSSYSDYPKDELIGERGEYYTQEEIEQLFPR